MLSVTEETDKIILVRLLWMDARPTASAADDVEVDHRVLQTQKKNPDTLLSWPATFFLHCPGVQSGAGPYRCPHPGHLKKGARPRQRRFHGRPGRPLLVAGRHYVSFLWLAAGK